MTTLFYDSFTGSGVIDGHSPDVGFSGVTWDAFDATLSGGFLTNPTTTPLWDSTDAASYGNISTPQGSASSLLVSFSFVTGSDVTPNADDIFGLDFEIFPTDVFNDGTRVIIRSEAGSGVWRLVLLNEFGDIVDANPSVAVSTTYNGTLTINYASLTATLDFMGESLQIPLPGGGTTGICAISASIGATMKLGPMTITTMATPLMPTVAIFGGDQVSATMPSPTVAMREGGEVTAALPSPTVAARGGNVVPVTMPTPTAFAHIIGIDTIGVNMNMPMPTVEFQMGDKAYATMPMPVVTVAVNYRVPHTVDVAMSMPTLDMRLGQRIAPALPMPTVALTGTTTGMIEVGAVMPMPIAAMAITKKENISVSATMPMATLVGYGGALVSATISGFTVAAQGTTGSTIGVRAQMPLFQLDIEITADDFMSVEATMPMLVPGPYGTIKAVMPMGQLTAIGHAVVAVTYEAYAVNLKHIPVRGVEPVDEMTRYTNFPFTHVVRYKNSYYGVGSDGNLYLLEGTTDNATPISWAWKTALDDFKTPNKKTLYSVNFGGRVGPAATITVYEGKTSPNVYNYATPRDASPQNYRQLFGKGMKDRYYALGATGDGDLMLDDMTPNHAVLARKI